MIGNQIKSGQNSQFIVNKVIVTIFQMQVLYHSLISQIRRQEIQSYNRKHAQYLKRTGKLAERNQPVSQSYNTDFQNKERRRRKRSFDPNQLQGTSNQRSQKYWREKQLDQARVEIETQDIDQQIQSMQIKREQKNEEKQRKIKPLALQSAIIQQIPAENQQVQLFECPEGCGRKFAAKQLQKHAKNCKKVFQQKRKPFQVKKTDQEAEMAKRQVPKVEEKKNPNEKPKWKKQSQKWRKMFSDNANTKNKNQVQQQEIDDRIQCPSCGRKFNQKAAERHISSCLKRQQRK